MNLHHLRIFYTVAQRRSITQGLEPFAHEPKRSATAAGPRKGHDLTQE